MDLTQDQIQQMISDALDAREVKNGYGVSIVPYHIHSGTDSPQVDYNNLLNTPAPPTPVKYPTEINLAWSKPFATSDTAAGIAFNSATAPTRMITGGPAVPTVYTFRNFAGDLSDSWFPIGNATISHNIAGTLFCYHNGAFYAAATSTTGIIQITDSDSPSSTACTISGTTLLNVLGLASDGTYLYNLDSTSTIKKFTVSGSTLTYVSTITLAHVASTGLHVDTTHIYAHDNSNPTLTLYKFDLTGANVANQTFQNNSNGFPVIKQIIKGPDGGLWMNITASSAAGGQSVNFLKKCSF